MAGLADYINVGANLAPNAFGELAPRLSAGDYTGAAGAALRGVAASPISAGSDVVNAATAAAPAVTRGLANFGRALLGQSSPPAAQPIAVQPQAPPQAPQAAPAWTTNPVSSSFTPGPMFHDLLQFRGTPSAQPAAAQGPQFSAMPAGPGVSFAPGINARPATAGLTFQQAIALHQLAKPVLTPVEQAQQTLHGMAMQQNTYEARRKALLDLLPSFGANYQMFRNAAGSGVGTGYPE